jgi:hypothetical protein
MTPYSLVGGYQHFEWTAESILRTEGGSRDFKMVKITYQDAITYETTLHWKFHSGTCYIRQELTEEADVGFLIFQSMSLRWFQYCDYVESDDRVTDELGRFGWKRSSRNLGVVWVFVWREWGIPPNDPRIASVPAEISSQVPPE